MAGSAVGSDFRELISPYLREKIEEVRLSKGEDSPEYQALYLQYYKTEAEEEDMAEDNSRHWEADVTIDIGKSEKQTHGLERLYDRSVVIEPTMACAAHCRYCLRANYGLFNLSNQEIIDIAKYCGTGNRRNLREVLVTGGDPLIVPKKVKFLVDQLVEHAPNIEVIRIGTRMPMHNPAKCDEKVFDIFNSGNGKLRFEIATQVNHTADLFPEVISVYEEMEKIPNVRIYSQNVILKGVNDNIEALVELYQTLRDLNIEPHYLFHCVPMKGMHHFRTTVHKALELTKELSNGGRISGRAKPMYTIMTDIGKITLYDGTILERDPQRNRVLLQSAYSYDQRKDLNPSWRLPANASVDENGYLRVWYLDGKDGKDD